MGYAGFTFGYIHVFMYVYIYVYGGVSVKELISSCYSKEPRLLIYTIYPYYGNLS